MIPGWLEGPNAPVAWQALQTLGALVAGGVLLIAVAAPLISLRRARLAPVPVDLAPEAALEAAVSKAVPLWIRLATLLVLAGAIFVPAYLGSLWWGVAVIILTGMGLYEGFQMLRVAGTEPDRVAGTITGLALPITTVLAGPEFLGVVIAAGLLLVIARTLFADDDVPYLQSLAGTWLMACYVGLLSSFLAALHVGPHGFGQVVFFMMVIQLADIGGLMGGLLLGRHKLAPRLSPGKTWEGAIAGVVAAAGTGALFSFCLPGLSLPVAIGIATLLAPVSLIGDLAASGLKRAAGLKDFGNILPGHGGILDRFDGYLFAAPVAWALFLVLAS